jgi:hypothetical protein
LHFHFFKERQWSAEPSWLIGYPVILSGSIWFNGCQLGNPALNPNLVLVEANCQPIFGGSKLIFSGEMSMFLLRVVLNKFGPMFSVVFVNMK